MADTEVQIGDKVIGENTKVTVTIKTLAWIIGGVIGLFSTLFTIAYFDLKSRLETNIEKMEQDKKLYTESVLKEVNTMVEKLREKNEDFLIELGDIKGNISVILDRTSAYRDGTTSAGQGFRNNNPQEADKGFKNNTPK